MKNGPLSRNCPRSKSKRPSQGRRAATPNQDEPTQKSPQRAPKAQPRRAIIQKETEEEPSSVVQKKKVDRKKSTDSTTKIDAAAIQDFMDYHTKIENVQKDLEQFHQQSAKIDEENSKIERHEKCCQFIWRSRDPDEHCLDANRVVLLKDDGQEGEFYHASKCKFDGLERQYILAQAPMATTTEDFWKMVFQEQSPVVVLLCEFYEDGKEASETFWPSKTGEYKYYGTMFINNKKKEEKGKLNVFTIEVSRLFGCQKNLQVLPDGCSNSLLTTVFHYTLWKPNESAINASLLLSIRSAVKLQEKDSMTVVSCRGTGRAAIYAAADAVISRLHKGLKTRVLDVALQVKKQRFRSISLDLQYHEIQRLVLHYFAGKTKSYVPVYTKYQTNLKEMLNNEAAEKKQEEKPGDNSENE